jgi:hypothetical protein
LQLLLVFVQHFPFTILELYVFRVLRIRSHWCMRVLSMRRRWHHMPSCEEPTAQSSRIHHLRKSSLARRNQSEGQKTRRSCKSYTNGLAKRQTRFVPQTKHLEITICLAVKNPQHIHPEFTICVNYHWHAWNCNEEFF